MVAHTLWGVGDLEFGGLENRFQKTCRFKDSEVTTVSKKIAQGLVEMDRRTPSISFSNATAGVTGDLI